MTTRASQRTRVLSRDVYTQQVEPDGVSEELQTASVGLTEGTVAEIGLWEAGPGLDTDTEVEEVFLVLAGAGSVAFEDGTTVGLHSGVVVRLVAGERTTWNITERIRKLYIAAAPCDEAPAQKVPIEPRTTRVLADHAQTSILTGQGHAGLWVEGGWPRAAVEQLASLGDVVVSIWEISAGVVTDIENDEWLLVLQGTGGIRFEDGDLVDLRPGALLRLQVGERAEWTVIHAVRVLAISRRAS